MRICDNSLYLHVVPKPFIHNLLTSSFVMNIDICHHIANRCNLSNKRHKECLQKHVTLLRRLLIFVHKKQHKAVQ